MYLYLYKEHIEMTSWDLKPTYDDVIKWKYFRVAGPLWEESTGHRWITLTKAIIAELGCFKRLSKH